MYVFLEGTFIHYVAFHLWGYIIFIIRIAYLLCITHGGCSIFTRILLFTIAFEDVI